MYSLKYKPEEVFIKFAYQPNHVDFYYKSPMLYELSKDPDKDSLELLKLPLVVYAANKNVVISLRNQIMKDFENYGIYFTALDFEILEKEH